MSIKCTPTTINEHFDLIINFIILCYYVYELVSVVVRLRRAGDDALRFVSLFIHERNAWLWLSFNLQLKLLKRSNGIGHTSFYADALICRYFAYLCGALKVWNWRLFARLAQILSCLDFATLQILKSHHIHSRALLLTRPNIEFITLSYFVF